MSKKPSDEQAHQLKQVEEIMEQRFFGPADWGRCYNVKVKSSEPFPWSLDLLRSQCPFHPDKTISETHGVVFSPRSFRINGSQTRHKMSLSSLKRLHDGKKQPKFFHEEYDWYNTTEFTRTRPDFSWHLILLRNTPQTLHLTYPDQMEVLRSFSDQYESPLAVIEALKLLTLFKKSHTVYNSDVVVRCADHPDADLAHVTIGNFDKQGLQIGACLDFMHYQDERFPEYSCHIGLAVERIQ